MDRDKVKFVVEATAVLIASVAVSVTVGGIIKGLVPLNELTKGHKALVIVGSGVLGGVAATAGGEYTYQMVDGIFDNIYTVIDKFGKINETGIEVVNEDPI